MLKKEMLKNQALGAHALFFDDVHRNLVLATDKDGNPAGRFAFIPEACKVLENGDVTFSFFAPNAKSVQVAGLGGGFPEKRHDMVKGEDGWWQVTVSGIDSGYHYHEYYVDGTRALNPYAPYGYGCGRVINFFELPDKYSNFYLLQDVPHG
ncbi:MAG: enterochelin esterase, partial [Papillibacter sp.]|nr:enterochelin esterase [Papillibacter sp.]